MATVARRRRRCPRRRSGEERGAVSLELVIATPLLLLLVMGVIQFALWEHATHVASTVAQQDVAVARLQGQTAAGGQAEANTVLGQLGTGVLADPDITTRRGIGTTTVTMNGRVESIIGIFHLPVHATATAPTEPATVP